jgi:hypothetical protein
MKISSNSFVRHASALSAALALAACGGFGTDSIIGGTLTGLGAGLSIVLTDNGADNLTLTSDGKFVFATKVAAGSAYSAAVLTQPIGQTCTVANASGTVNVAGSDVTNIAVTCATTSSVFVTVTGLAAGTGVTLSNGTTALSIASNGSYAFPGLVAAGSTYTITITVPPVLPHKCTLANDTGTIPATGGVTVTVTCS